MVISPPVVSYIVFIIYYFHALFFSLLTFRIYLSLAYSRKTHLKCHFISFSVCIILINVFLREAHQARKIVLFFVAKEGIARLKRQFSITIKIEHLCQWEDLIILCGIRINCQMGLSNKTVSFYNFFFIFIFLLAVIARTQSFLN